MSEGVLVYTLKSRTASAGYVTHALVYVWMHTDNNAFATGVMVDGTARTHTGALEH